MRMLSALQDDSLLCKNTVHNATAHDCCFHPEEGKPQRNNMRHSSGVLPSELECTFSTLVVRSHAQKRRTLCMQETKGAAPCSACVGSTCSPSTADQLPTSCPPTADHCPLAHDPDSMTEEHVGSRRLLSAGRFNFSDKDDIRGSRCSCQNVAIV